MFYRGGGQVGHGAGWRSVDIRMFTRWSPSSNACEDIELLSGPHCRLPLCHADLGRARHVPAVYDRDGQLLGELGASTPPICMALPLPLHYCYAHILLAAARLQLWQVAKRAAGVLLPQFITASPARPVWQAHPMARFSLRMAQVSAAARPLLRLLVQALYAYAGYQGRKQLLSLLAASSSCGPAMADAACASCGDSSSGLAGTAASRELLLSLSNSQLPQQVALLEACKRLLLAMQVGVGWRLASADACSCC